MVVVVRCPICKETKKIRDTNRFFVCCKTTHTVQGNLVCEGVPKKVRDSKPEYDKWVNRGNSQEPIKQQADNSRDSDEDRERETVNRDSTSEEKLTDEEETDVCAHCGTVFRSFGGEYPEKCPVCGGKWR